MQVGAGYPSYEFLAGAVFTCVYPQVFTEMAAHGTDR